MSKLADFCALTLLAEPGLPKPEREYRFHHERRWRFDFAWPAHKVAIEVDGGTFVGGRHTRGMGYERDCEKRNTATVLGWRVLNYPAAMIRRAQHIHDLQELLKP